MAEVPESTKQASKTIHLNATPLVLQFALGFDSRGEPGHTRIMNRLGPISGSAGSRVSCIMQGMCRVLLCLSLWNGPLPLIHAHEFSGPELSRDESLAVHIQLCHSPDDCDECRGWHLHLMLWGEILPEHSNPDASLPAPPAPPVETEYTLLSCSVETSGISGNDAAGKEATLVASCDVLTPLALNGMRLDRASVFPYRIRVTAQRDVSRLLMVSRC